MKYSCIPGFTTSLNNFKSRNRFSDILSLWLNLKQPFISSNKSGKPLVCSFILDQGTSLYLFIFLLTKSVPISIYIAKYPKFHTICASCSYSSNSPCFILSSGEAVYLFQVKGVSMGNYLLSKTSQSIFHIYSSGLCPTILTICSDLRLACTYLSS